MPEQQPINVTAALSAFDEVWSPRILAHVNDYHVRIAKVIGEYVWHRHDDTDEFFMVLDGSLDIGVRDVVDAGAPGGFGERTVCLGRGDCFVVPRSVEHRPSSESGASLLLIEPGSTVTTGDFAGAVPASIDSTTGHELRLG